MREVRSLARSLAPRSDRSIDLPRNRPRARSGCCWQRRRIPQRDPRRVSRTPAALLSRVRADDAMGSSYALAPAPDRPTDQRRPTRTNDDNGIAGGALSPARHDTQGPVPRPPPLSTSFPFPFAPKLRAFREAQNSNPTLPHPLILILSITGFENGKVEKRKVKKEIITDVKNFYKRGDLQRAEAGPAVRESLRPPRSARTEA